MQAHTPSRFFPSSYAEARHKFLDAAAEKNAQVQSFELEDYQGAFGEILAMDVASVGNSDAKKLLIVSSGTHGPEGFCGSGCQVAALHDTDLLQRLEKADVRLLLIHAVNPYGFSHVRRTNEDNVDLNRNHIDFSKALPRNAGYPGVHRVALPADWPPTPEQEAARAAYIEQHGERGYRTALCSGQYEMPEGMFYGGTAPTWSNRTVRSIIREHSIGVTDIAWIDVHTGLGPHGHGEKIYSGRPDGLSRARAWWGADVFAPFEGDCVSPDVSGPIVGIAYDECPTAAVTLMGLEFGTLPDMVVLDRLRADQWVRNNPHASESQRRAIHQDLYSAFYCDHDYWKGSILGQMRVVLLQSLQGLSSC
ncbi:M14 family metallopeptidase [Pseudomonas protegens]|uniref:M14 family metallopeptidase n=1 Tax=Pseudomonas protegens TaxID=380021 RepID=UPI0006429FB9|nr:M14 family metallopeptidase [Pseudomonas protegens]